MKAIYATDLSSANEAAIKNETGFECLSNIGIDEIHLVTVVPSNVHTGMPGIDFEKRRQRDLQRYRDTMEKSGFKVETHVVRGTPHRRINGIAEAVQADMTIVGSRGRSPLENRIIGSTARNLSRTTVAPLLVNRIERGTDEPDVVRKHLFKKILFATDFSENAERAFNAFSYLRHSSIEATVVHVESPKDNPEEIEDVEEKLGRLTERLEDWGLDSSFEVRRGDPADEILELEGDIDPSVILIGSRGRSRLRRLLLGSVSEDIVVNADSNVLLVPPERMA